MAVDRTDVDAVRERFTSGELDALVRDAGLSYLLVGAEMDPPRDRWTIARWLRGIREPRFEDAVDCAATIDALCGRR